ncbi:MAG: DUF1573 domain-containing protein [Ignavibacteria bacterium]|nr:DUF1573 domain-containing protein [Ignavibacteria bacterium]
MKRYIALAAFLLSAACTTFTVAQTTPSTAPDYKCFQPVGTADFSFGIVEANVPVTHTFVFKNGCKDVIEINQVKASCGCTATVLSQKIVPPGEEAKVEVKFTPYAGTRGKVSKTVSVYLKDQSDVHTTLRFSAEVRTDLDIQPPYIQMYGIEVGKPFSATATLKNTTDADLEIVEVTITASTYADTSGKGGNATVAMPLSTVAVTPGMFTLKPGESKIVTVTVTPDYPGQILASMRIKTNKSEESIQVTGIARKPL